ncbi:hypothetical protein P67b_00072 [Ruegeria phage Tedan]|nr:hypothetical protein P67b_00072 [Ruegeria phage Tedan]
MKPPSLLWEIWDWMLHVRVGLIPSALLVMAALAFHDGWYMTSIILAVLGSAAQEALYKGEN